MEVEKKLNELGYELPNPPVPAANYIGFVRAKLATGEKGVWLPKD